MVRIQPSGRQYNHILACIPVKPLRTVRWEGCVYCIRGLCGRFYRYRPHTASAGREMKHLTLLRGHLVLIQPTDRQYNKIHGVHAAVKPLQTVRRRVVDGSNVNFFLAVLRSTTLCAQRVIPCERYALQHSIPPKIAK